MLCAARYAAAAFYVLSVATALLGQDTKPVEGTLTLSGKPYKLQHTVAYETKIFGKPAVAVIASDRMINMETVKKALLESKDNPDVSLRQPHVKLTFDGAGKVHTLYATAAGFTTSSGGDAVTGELKREGDRVVGKAKLPSQGEGDLQRSFDFQFSVGLIGSASESVQQAAPLAKLGVSGVFKGNGKDSRLAFVTARPGEPFDDKPSIKLIFTEKDHSRDPRADFRAAFGDYGSALIISCHEDGSIFGCEVAHAAHPKKPFSASGTLGMTEFQIAGGQVQGELSSSGEAKAFDQTWEVNLKFAAPFAGQPKAADSKKSAKDSPAVAQSTEPTNRKRGKSETADRASEKEKKATSKLNVKDLAILQGVENVEYKKLVEHIAFHSTRDYKTLAAELAKKLDAQGWKKDGSDLVGVSAILKRKLDGASLTIFVKPAADGSTVTIMTEGLSWE